MSIAWLVLIKGQIFVKIKITLEQKLWLPITQCS